MASRSGQATIRGRFSVGDIVTLTKVAHEGVLRAEGGEDVATKTVKEDPDSPRVAYVRFTGLEVGARYIAHGISDGVPIQVRLRGRPADDPNEVFEQAPIQPDRVRLTDGTWADERPTKESAPQILAAQADLRHVKKGTVLRSDTLRGEAHPVDPDERTPKRTQEDVGKGVVQMSDTRPREVDGETVGGGGEAAELVLGPQRQEDVPKGAVQRSDTPTGTAQVIPAGDAVQQAKDRESSLAKEQRGDWTRAGAEPIDAPKVKIGPPKGATQKQSEERHEEILKSDREAALSSPPTDQPADAEATTTGLDAQGQPVADDVAAAAGVEPADKPAEARTTRRKSSKRSAAAKKAAATRKANAERAAAKPALTGSAGTTRTGAATTTNTPTTTANKEQ